MNKIQKMENRNKRIMKAGFFTTLIAIFLVAALIPCVNAQENNTLNVKVSTPTQVVEGQSYWVLVYVKDSITKKGVKANVVLSGIGSGSSQTNKNGVARIKYTAPQTSIPATRYLTVTVTSTGYSFTRVSKTVLLKPRLDLEIDYDTTVSRGQALANYRQACTFYEDLGRTKPPVYLYFFKTINVKVVSDGIPVEGVKVGTYGSRLVNRFVDRVVYTDEQGIATFKYVMPAVDENGEDYAVTFRAVKKQYYRGAENINIRVTR